MNKISYCVVAVALILLSACHTMRNTTGNNPKTDCRKIKLTILESYSKEQDKFTENDQFITVVYNGHIILTTPVMQDMNLAKWKDQYVVFDYCENSMVNITQLDDDYTFHDVLSQYNGALKPGEMKIDGPLSYVKIKVEYTNDNLQTTHYSIPTNTMNLKEFLESIKASDETFKGEYLKSK